MTAMLLALGLSMGTAAHDEMPQTQIMIQMTVWKGDPLGSKEEGTVKCLSAPRIVTLNGHQAIMQIGGQVPVPVAAGAVKYVPTGLILKLTPKCEPEGTVLLRLESQITEVAPGRGVDLGNGIVVPAINSRNLLLVRMMKDAQPVRVRIAADSATDQTWIEVAVNVVRPDSR